MVILVLDSPQKKLSTFTKEDMMPNWIDEAKKKADLKKLEDSQKEKARVLSIQQEQDRNLAIFHKYTSKTKQEIEKVLEEAQKQGLIIKGPEEGYLDSRRDTPGFLFQERQEQVCYDTTWTYYYSWAYQWTILLPPNIQNNKGCISLNILLSLLENEKSDYIPSTSAKKVENDIKDWLYEVYLK